jgi:hypothetical protein
VGARISVYHRCAYQKTPDNALQSRPHFQT